MSHPSSAPERNCALERCCQRSASSPRVLATAIACFAHATLFFSVYSLKPTPSHAAQADRVLLEVELPPAPPPVTPPAPAAVEEPPAPEEKAPEPIQAPPAPKKAPTPRLSPPPPPQAEPEPPKAPEPVAPAPAAAEAAHALTADESSQPTESGNTLVTGDGAHYAGGTTERGGTAKQAVKSSQARAFGVEGGTGTAAPDRSRAPQLASGLRWDCPIPDEALDEGIEHATVGLLVEVAPDGKLLAVEVKNDPGYGFARVARTCALRKRWLPGLDRHGQPTRARQLVNVNF